jgi:hypothetical protein
MRKTILILALLTALGAGGLLLATGQRAPVPAAGNVARTHASDAPVRGILFAQPFALETPAVHWWRKERPSYSAGWLLVLEVDPALVQPTNRAEPVLFVGHQTAERVNHGWKSGRVVAIVPSPAGADGQPTLDLASAKVWFGDPALPEETDAAAVEQAFAAAAGAQPFSAAEIAQARALGGTPIVFQTRGQLDVQAGRLILEHAPEERELGESLLRTP